MYGFEFIAC